MTDLLALAAGGLLSVNGTDADAAKGTPLRYRGEFASIHAACDAVLAVLGALHARLADGRGQRIDVSAPGGHRLDPGDGGGRPGCTPAGCRSATGRAAWSRGASSSAPTAFVLLQVTEDAQWFNLRRVIGEPAWAQPDVFDTTAMRSELQDVVHGLLAPELTRFTVDEFLDACQREGVAAARVQTAIDLLAWEHLRARGYFTPIELGGAAGVCVEAPTPPWRYAGTPRPTRRVSPALGAHTAEVLAEWRAAPGRHRCRAATPRSAPLDGLRVVDMTWVWAGPFAAMQFAHLGADVVKLESSSRVDVTRRLGPFADGVVDIDRSGYFNQYNQGKRSVVLDVKQPRGLALLEAGRRHRRSGHRQHAPGRAGPDGSGLRRRCAASTRVIVAVAMSGFGEDGPERDRMAYGSIIDALSGVAASNGAPGGGPTDFPMSLPDPAAGIHAAIAATAALYRVRCGGPGDRVEVAMLEATLSAFPWPVLIEAAGAGPVVCVGNRDEAMSPHGTFRCAGAGRLGRHRRPRRRGVRSPRRRRSGVPSWPPTSASPRSWRGRATRTSSRRSSRAWTSSRSRDDVAAALRAAGVPAEAVQTMDEVAASPVLAARQFLLPTTHRRLGVRPLPGPAWTASRSPMVAATAAPCFGEHTREVLAELAGLSDDAAGRAGRGGSAPLTCRRGRDRAGSSGCAGPCRRTGGRSRRGRRCCRRTTCRSC